ncbi:hypothetical protein ACNQFZ_09125 [Schinkia sp. CFF1]
MRKDSSYPTLDFREDGKNGYINGRFLSTTLPDPKYDFEGDGIIGDGYIDELEVVSRDKSKIYAGTMYSVQGTWEIINSSKNPAITSYSSESSSPSCSSCDYNTVFGTTSYLGGFYINDVMSNIYSSSFADFDTIAEEGVNESKPVNEEYYNIKTIEDLDKYKEKADNKLNKYNDDSKDVSFVVTFKEPINAKDLDDIIQENKLNVKEVYARGINKNGEIETIGTNRSDYDSLNTLSSELSSFKGFIEIEGSAKPSKLQKLKKNSIVYSIEASIDGLIPAGLYWKMESLSKK